MKLKVVGTGSSGNCYVLESSKGSCLVLESGVSYKKIEKYINYKPSLVVGCLITHEHEDHSKYFNSYESNGISCFMSNGTNQALTGSDKLNINPVNIGKWNKLKDFSFYPFKVKHDAKEPINYVVFHDEMGMMVFITDASSINQCISSPEHWLIEANYSEKELMDSKLNGDINCYLSDRIYDNHLSIEKTIDILKRNGGDKSKTITLCHLSNTNADASKFKKLVRSEIGLMCDIAKKGLIINL